MGTSALELGGEIQSCIVGASKGAREQGKVWMYWGFGMSGVCTHSSMDDSMEDWMWNAWRSGFASGI